MIDVINLKKSFGDLEILKGINITINKGTSWQYSDRQVPVKVHF